MKRGEIWWVELGSLGQRRPVLLLSRNDAYAVRSLVLAAPITKRLRGVPSELRLGTAEGLPEECAANLEVITTIPKDSLVDLVAALAAEKVEAMESAIKFAMGMEA